MKVEGPGRQKLGQSSRRRTHGYILTSPALKGEYIYQFWVLNTDPNFCVRSPPLWDFTRERTEALTLTTVYSTRSSARDRFCRNVSCMVWLATRPQGRDGRGASVTMTISGVNDAEMCRSSGFPQTLAVAQFS